MTERAFEKKTETVPTTVLWHWENFRDYSRFPSFDRKEYPELLPPEFEKSPSQCKMYELWSWGQARPYRLRIYLSHFPGFVPPGFGDSFFDFRCNLTERRHQSFTDAYYRGGSAVMFAPGLIPRFDFALEGWIAQAEADRRLTVLTSRSGKQAFIWIIPHNVLKIFARPLDGDLLDRCAGSDSAYWLTMARLAGEVRLAPADAGEDYLPQYSLIPDFKRIPLPENVDLSPVASGLYPAWTDADFDAWMSNQSFTFAKTMRWCPHEYIYVWKRSLEDQKNYLMALDYVHRNCVIDIWRSRFQVALKRGGFKYWHCGTIDLLNRTSEDLKRKIILEDARIEYGSAEGAAAPAAA